MTGPPEFEVTRGSPTPQEERAIREAIVALWREDQAKAAREARLVGWALAARLESTGVAALGPRSWRAGLGFTQPGVVPARRTGRNHQG